MNNTPLSTVLCVVCLLSGKRRGGMSKSLYDTLSRYLFLLGGRGRGVFRWGHAARWPPSVADADVTFLGDCPEPWQLLLHHELRMLSKLPPGGAFACVTSVSLTAFQPRPRLLLLVKGLTVSKVTVRSKLLVREFHLHSPQCSRRDH